MVIRQKRRFNSADKLLAGGVAKCRCFLGSAGARGATTPAHHLMIPSHFVRRSDHESEIWNLPC